MKAGHKNRAQKLGLKGAKVGGKGHKGMVHMMQRLTTKGTRAGCKHGVQRLGTKEAKR